jgi:phosphatidylserine/phosphatidylglycerophosphate/cardiolipin synthase-like enzyme
MAHLLLCVFLLLGWTSVARADDVRLVLHDPLAPTLRSAPADACDVEVCTSLLALIEGATRSIDLAFYGFRDQSRLLEALLAARARGVEIRGVIDRDLDDRSYYASTDAWLRALPVFHTDHDVDVAAAAANAGRYAHYRPRCPRPAGHAGPVQCVAIDLGGGRCYLAAHASAEPIEDKGAIMHDKFAVVDERWVWTGSTNASDSCTGGYNANLVLVVDSPRVAGWYRAEFEQMYVDGRFHATKLAQAPMRTVLADGTGLADGDDGTRLEVLFSPQHEPIRRAVEPLLRGARSSIDIAVFYLTHEGVAQDLVDAHNRGVRVRVILDATGAANAYSKHEALRLAGIPVAIEDMGGKMHAKSALIDGRIVVGGSMNWTAAGESGNDENTIVLRSEALGAQYAAWFERLWGRIDPRWRADGARPDPESRDSGTACADGVDNDYDGHVDAADPGCGATSASAPPLPHRIVPTLGQPCSWALLDPSEGGWERK